MSLKVKSVKMPSNCYLDYIEGDDNVIHYATISNPHTGYVKQIDAIETQRILKLNEIEKVSDNVHFVHI